MDRDLAVATWQGVDRVAGRSPVQLGIDMVAIFEQIDSLPDKVQWTYQKIADRLGNDLDPSLRRACEAVAASIDADSPGIDRHPYHNRQHYCEVALSGYFLGLLYGAGVADTQLVVLAALIHDWVHDGQSHAAFRLERASVERARPLLEAAGLSAATRARVATLVLATDSTQGWRFLAAVGRTHRDDSAGLAVGQVPPVPVDAPELGALISDTSLAGLARLLCEADVLPSIGLTFAHSMRLQRHLSREWQRPLDAHDKLRFIEGALASGILGDFFLPNVLATRAQLIDLLHASA